MPRIVELPALPAVQDGAALPCSYVGTTQQVAVSQLKAYILAGTSLSGLSDATVATPAAGQVLRYDGTKWANASLGVADIGATGTRDATTFLCGNGTWATPPGTTGATALSGLSDVAVSAPASAQVLRYNGTKWANAALGVGDISATGTKSSSTYLRGDGTWAAPATGATALTGLSDVAVSAPASGHLLQHNGTKWANVATRTASNDTVTATGGSSARTLAALFADVANVLNFGADPTGAADSTAAIQNAINTGKAVYIPAGTYKVTGLTISASQTTLFGDSEYETVLTNSTAATPTIKVNTGLFNAVVRNLRLTRSVAATSGGHGLQATGTYTNCHFENIVSDNNWFGLALGSTDYSLVSNCIAQLNYSHGFWIGNNGAVACQWYLFNNLSQKNNGSGLYFAAVAGSTGTLSVGDIVGFRTFANTGYGIMIAGLAALPIAGVRLRDCFLGEDGNSELYLDTFSGMHSITNCFFELAGQGATGRTMGTAATQQGFGVLLSQNNNDVSMTGCVIDGCSYSGISTAAKALMVTGGRIGTNGRAGVAQNQAGILQSTAAARVVANGVRLGPDDGTTVQQHGVLATDGQNVALIGCDLTGNATAPTSATTNWAAMTIVGCLPWNGTGANLVTQQYQGYANFGGATGTNILGGINVAGGLMKNGTAYNNP